jgi:hypothetical protein
MDMNMTLSSMLCGSTAAGPLKGIAAARCVGCRQRLSFAYHSRLLFKTEAQAMGAGSAQEGTRVCWRTCGLLHLPVAACSACQARHQPLGHQVLQRCHS